MRPVMLWSSRLHPVPPTFLGLGAETFFCRRKTASSNDFCCSRPRSSATSTQHRLAPLFVMSNVCADAARTSKSGTVKHYCRDITDLSTAYCA